MKLLKGKKNIAEIYDIEDHTLYMKLYNQKSLRDSIDNDEVYAQLDKYDIAYQIQNGLKQIHKLGYVHSDLKSSYVKKHLLVKQMYIFQILVLQEKLALL